MRILFWPYFLSIRPKLPPYRVWQIWIALYYLDRCSHSVQNIVLASHSDTSFSSRIRLFSQYTQLFHQIEFPIHISPHIYVR